jgi:RNA polymerase sigma-70 factor (ECF subfamily)
VRLDGGSLRPWVLGIAVNVTRNVARASRRHEAAMSRLQPTPEQPDFADELAGRIDDAARLALGRLRPGEREVLALCVWAGLDYAAAAEALGVPVGTVRSRLSRARRKLRDLASGQEGELRPAGEQVRGSRQDAARPVQEGTR